MIAAVFDVDRTLLPGTTAERIFIRCLWREGLIGWRQILAGCQFALSRRPTAVAAEWRAQRPYLQGLSRRRIAALGRHCFTDEVLPRLSRHGLACLRQHQAHGALTVLLSGSLIDLIEPMRAHLQVDVAIASQPRTVGDRLVGGLAGPHPYGHVKAALVRALASERGIDLAASYCYADHASDLPMLALFGHPVCVNPDARLRRMARRLAWPVEAFA